MYCMFITLVVMSTHYHYMGVLGVNQSIFLIKVLKKGSKKMGWDVKIYTLGSKSTKC